MMTLYGRRGWGSVLIEAQLAYYDLPFRFEEVDDLFTSASARKALARINPLAQVPTLLLDDGRVLTESAAITLHLADLTGRDDLVPGADAPERAAFLRWLVFLVTNLYPTFTYADEPTRFVADATAAKAFRARVDDYAQSLWRMVEHAAAAPWFLGERRSALDLYIGVMTRWRPRRPWFLAEAPKLHAIAQAIDAEPAFAGTLARNFAE
ncbi:glutathione S-transferase family protein [Dokdonella koreensis]|uniref:Glutathione S-transferase, N-terminal domain n=1 Tax=Dokdonella koreensis DS-123 TaxID=1300342 RepID=A0A160DX00_9GAMM|nr:glutathione S-transferase family protein [Dokdonella koreensis]ANB18463.1 Glutathione S-transferase, N-terminal domain [Dokdonella koreensis DS-123]